MPSRDRTKGSRGGAKTPRSAGSEWLPWGLYDDIDVPELSEETIQKAADQLNVTDEAKKEEVRDRLREVAVTYWIFHRAAAKPGPKWFREQVAPIKRATERLYRLIHNHPGGIGLAPLAMLTLERMQRPLINRLAGLPLDLHPESDRAVARKFHEGV